MKNLTLTEFIAILFAGLAGTASAVQAYVSWETRGEVSRAIIFAQRIDACAKVMAAIEPFVAKARPQGRAAVSKGQPDGRYSLPSFYYRMSAGNAAFRAKHNPRVAELRVASSALQIVSPSKKSEELIAYFDNAVTKDITAGRFMNQAEMIAWLERLEASANTLKQDCRGLLQSSKPTPLLR